MSALKPSTMRDIKINASATVMGEALHYGRLEAYGLPFETWDSQSSSWKQTCIDHAAFALERLAPITKAPAPSRAIPAPILGEGEKAVWSRTVGELRDNLIILDDDDDLQACAYCGCAILDLKRTDGYCCDLCEIGDSKGNAS